uniref:Uncharacterized protein n=1 Tax=Ananas comosus var. bracteatus TaxID=296719 RepID=A0A6V7NSB9_ANACO|nr:unnamed protein product [Ananas comosus var. bracteatus]
MSGSRSIFLYSVMAHLIRITKKHLLWFFHDHLSNKTSPTLFILLRTECARGFESTSWIRRNQSFVDSKCGRFMDSRHCVRGFGRGAWTNKLVCARSREDKREV